MLSVEMTPNIRIDKKMCIHPMKEEPLVFYRESVGTSFLIAALDGWDLGEDETLHIGFETEDKTPIYTVSPIALSYDYDSGLYYIEIPAEVLSVAGTWNMQCQKRWGWNEDSGLYDYAKAGDMLSFTVKYGILNINGTAVSKADYAGLQRQVLDLRNTVAGITDMNLRINGVPLVGDKSAQELSLLSSEQKNYDSVSLVSNPDATGEVLVLSENKPYTVPLQEIARGRFCTVSSGENTDGVIVGNYIFKEIN